MTPRIAAAVCVLAALVVGAWWALRPAAPREPSVLFVCSDAHRADFAPVPGDARGMPKLARWAADAVVYRRAYSTASWTLPAIASVLTGLDARRHGAGKIAAAETPAGDASRAFSEHRPALETLPERLAAAGRATVLVHAQPLYRLSGLARDGWDAAYEVHGSGADVNHVAFEAIAEARGRPLFLLVHYGDLLDHRERHLTRAQAGAATTQRSAYHAAYRAAVREVDAHVAALLARWDEEFGSASSLVVFYSDHGAHLSGNTTAPTDHGNSMDEALLHVPLIVRWPDGLGVAPGERDEPVSLVDLFPSVLDALALDAPAADALDPPAADALDAPAADALDGRSLARGAPAAERAFFADFQLRGRELGSVRQGERKLVIDLAGGGSHLVDTSAVSGPGGERGARVDDAAAKARLTNLYLQHVDAADRSAP